MPPGRFVMSVRPSASQLPSGDHETPWTYGVSLRNRMLPISALTKFSPSRKGTTIVRPSGDHVIAPPHTWQTCVRGGGQSEQLEMKIVDEQVRHSTWSSLPSAFIR